MIFYIENQRSQIEISKQLDLKSGWNTFYYLYITRRSRTQ